MAAERMKRALGPLPSRCGNLPGIFAPLLNIRLMFFLVTCTKLTRSPSYPSRRLPYLMSSEIRGSAARRISRTRRIAFSVGSFLATNHRSTSGFGFTRASVGFADTLLAQLWSTVSNQKTVETTAPQTPAPATSGAPDRVKRFLHVLIEPRSYLNALYLLTAFPLGLPYFAFPVP